MLKKFHSSSLSEKPLVQAFPFHLVVSASCEIFGCGAAIGREIQPEVVSKDNLFDQFEIQHPSGIFITDQHVGQEGKLFLLASKHNSNLLLRGQLVAEDDQEYFVFLVSLWITNIDLLDKLGFTLQDFAVHGPLSDFLILVQAQRVSLSDSMRLSDELTHVNKELENRVAQRTNDLELKAKELLESKTTLEYEMRERERVEIELRHAQKLEMVGKLAAGIAHEINTPKQYMESSLSFLKESFTELGAVNSLLEKCLSKNQYSLGPKVIELKNLLDEVDFTYVCERGLEALDRALSGITRVTEIVGVMNEFTHPDRAEMDSADINRALDTVITIASNEYRYVATIKRSFGDLPKVCCF